MDCQIENISEEWKVLNAGTHDIIAKFDSEQDLKEFLAYEKVYEGKKEAIKLLMSFPHGSFVNSKYQRTENGTEDYTKWLISISHHDTYTNYYKAIDDKLDELLSAVHKAY